MYNIHFHFIYIWALFVIPKKGKWSGYENKQSMMHLLGTIFYDKNNKHMIQYDCHKDIAIIFLNSHKWNGRVWCDHMYWKVKV